MPPASVMTIDSTEAKIGRSMKKRENMDDYSDSDPEWTGSGGSEGSSAGALIWTGGEMAGAHGDGVPRRDAAAGARRETAVTPHAAAPGE